MSSIILMTLNTLFYPLHVPHLGQTGKAGIGFSSHPTYDRFKTTNFTFNPSFEDTPVLTYGVKKIDTEQFSNSRVDVVVQELTKTFLSMTVKTWADSITFDAVANWMACPKFK